MRFENKVDVIAGGSSASSTGKRPPSEGDLSQRATGRAMLYVR
jgi:hypothetical protein